MENENLKVYNAVRECPQEALKTISAGRLKGKSDINPMWRIKKLTELYGPAGIGWYYEIVKQWLETGANNEISAFCNINLYIKVNGEWSKPIQGTGGSSFVAKQNSGLYVSDECFKMALTDAISVACKALGFAANVYWDNDKTKYSSQSDAANTSSESKQYCCVECGTPFKPFTSKGGINYSAGQAYHICEKRYGKAMCKACRNKAVQKEQRKGTKEQEDLI